MTTKDDLMDNAEAESREQAKTEGSFDEAHERRIAWWREARVGLFIHWGPYSELGGFWKGQEVKAAYAEHIQLRAQIPLKEYEEVVKQFNPIGFDASEWVRAAKEAGLKYIVVTAKHHDGFAMYDSKASDYNIVEATPFGRDPMRELAEACAREGVKLCFYYSHAMDWHHPDSQGNTWDFPGNIGAYDPLESWVDDEDKRTRYERYLEEKAYPQVKELLTQYGPVGIIWFDCGHKITDEQGQKFVDLVHGTQPGCLVNRRVRRDGFGDYGNSSDNQLHVRASRRDWESIATLNNSWGYKKSDHDWKSPRDILHNLIDVVSMNGNFLINVGPTGAGEFDPHSLELLRQIGAWMKRNGDSIYGTTASPIGKPPWGRCTAKRNTLYLHVWEWPPRGELIVPGVRSRVDNVYLLADAEKKPLRHERLNADDFRIFVPAEAPDEISTVLVVELGEAVEANPVKRLYASDYPNEFGVFDGEIHGRTLRYDTGKKGRDDVTDWSDPEDWIDWEFRAAEPGTYNIEVAYGAEADAAGGTFTVSVGDGRLTAEVRNTGGWHEFRIFAIGRIEIPAAGTYTLAVKPEKIAGSALMNLRSVTLTAEA